MKNKVISIISILVALTCLTTIVVSAVDTLATPSGVEVVKDKVYYAYFNTGSNKGAVAFALDNQFTAYGDSQENISVCTKNTDGTYATLYTIEKEHINTWFSGKTEFTTSLNENLTSLLGGLSGLGFTVESEKTNVGFELYGQEIKQNTQYYVYIPENFFVDAAGNGNAGAYIELDAEKINAYTGDLLTDLKMASSGVYDLAIKGYETITGALSK